MSENNDLVHVPVARLPKRIRLEKEMIRIMQEVVKQQKKSPFEYSTKKLIIDKFLLLPEASPSAAHDLYMKCAGHTKNFFDTGMMMEGVVRDNLDLQKQLQEIKDMIMDQYVDPDKKMTITKDPALGMISALKAKNDAQKILADSIFKQITSNIDEKKNEILEKRTDTHTGSINVNMNLTGTLEEKTKQAVEIARKHADLLNQDVIECEFTAVVTGKEDEEDIDE